MAASTSPAVISQNVNQPSRGLARAARSKRPGGDERHESTDEERGEDEHVEDAVQRQAVIVGADHRRERRVDVDPGVLQRLEEAGDVTPPKSATRATIRLAPASGAPRRDRGRVGRDGRSHGRASTMIFPPMVWCAMPQYSWQMNGYSPGAIEAGRHACDLAREQHHVDVVAVDMKPVHDVLLVATNVTVEPAGTRISFGAKHQICAIMRTS